MAAMKIPQPLSARQSMAYHKPAHHYRSQYRFGRDLSCHDDRLAVKPLWLQNWIDTGDDLVDSEDNPITLSLYAMMYPAGSEVTLGENGGSSGCINYTIIVKPRADVAGASDIPTFDPAKVVFKKKPTFVFDRPKQEPGTKPIGFASLGYGTTGGLGGKEVNVNATINSSNIYFTLAGRGSCAGVRAPSDVHIIQS